MVFSHQTDDPDHHLVASFDHFYSRHTGGSGSMANRVIAHRGCNSELNHWPKTPELEEKLRVLNLRRGLGNEIGDVEESDRNGYLRPDMYHFPGEAFGVVCSVLNRIEGMEGRRAREDMRKLINAYFQKINLLMYIPQKQFRFDIAIAWIEKFLDERLSFHKIEALVPDFELRNHVRTMCKSVARARLFEGKVRTLSPKEERRLHFSTIPDIDLTA